MATTAFAPSAASSPQLDSLQPVAASPQISRTSAPMQHSASPPSSAASFSSNLLSTTSPSTSHLRQRPAYSPNPSSRLSTASLSFTLSHRDSFVPQYPSSLSYTSVRDFAYPNLHPLHYGSQPAADTPASSHRGSQFLDAGVNGGGWFSGNTFGYGGSSSQYRRLSDPAYPSFGTEERSGGWSGNWASGSRKGSTEHGGKADQLPPLQFEDGPPWLEDPDLHSPVVISSKHRKHKSSAAHMQSSQGYSRRPSKNAVVGDFNEGWRDEASAGGQGSRNNHPGDISDGEPGGEFHNQPGGRGYYTSEQDSGDFLGGSFSQGNGNQEYFSEEEDGVYSEDGEDDDFGDPSRLSNQYFITIASPAEEMHGKAVALFDFQKENENELGLVEGQVIWVSYRHGMGWLVAEDPKTRESGLVPEEYVRLLRDIQQPLFVEGSGADEDEEEGSELNLTTSHSPPASGYSNGMKPVVSTFSTSSQDVHPYSGPLHQPGEQAPPRTLSRSGHGGLSSQTQTPTVGGWEDRIEALERAREQALMEENHSGYKSRTGSTVSSTGDETPRAGHGGGWGGPRRDSSEIGEGETSHRRKNSRLGFVDEGEEGRDTNAEPRGNASNKGKDRAPEAVSETLPSTALSPPGLPHDKSSPTANVPTSANQLDGCAGLGIDFLDRKTANSAPR